MSLGKIIEFLFGIAVLPHIIRLIILFMFAYFGWDISTALITIIVLSVILSIILFRYRKALSIGLLIGIIIDSLLSYMKLI